MGRLVVSLLCVSILITRSTGHGDRVFSATIDTDDSSPQSGPDFWTYQGDIIVSQELRYYLEPEVNEDARSSHNRAYAAPKDLKRLWYNGVIPYEIDCSLKNMPDLVRIVHKAMREWEKHTCIRFVKRKQEDDFVRFFRGTHCYSTVGRPEGKKEVSVAYGCEFHHVMLHELGHVIGFWHEQSRPDRDEYVRILWSNIKSGWEYSFVKLNWKAVNSMDVPYDYASIMHYPYNAFSKNPRKRTIVPLIPNYDKPYKRISPLDILQVNMMYRCNDEKEIVNSKQRNDKRKKEIDVKETLQRRKENEVGNEAKHKKTETDNENVAVFGRRFKRNLESLKKHRKRIKRRVSNKTEQKKSKVKTKGECEDKIVACAAWAKMGFCQTRPDFMLDQCMISCDRCKKRTHYGDSHMRKNAVEKTDDSDKQRKPRVDTNKPKENKRNNRKPRRKWKKCQDELKSCRSYASLGYCKLRPDIMFVRCKKSCNRCPFDLRKMCVDENPRCSIYSKWHYCSHPRYKFVQHVCRRSCGVCSPDSCRDRDRYRCARAKRQGYCKSKIVHHRKVMKMMCAKTCHLCFNKGVYFTPLPPVKDLSCRDLYKACFGWSRLGYCENKQDFMNIYCRLSCGLCTVRASRHIKSSLCVDNDVSCDELANKNFCRQKPKYMERNCRRTCRFCTEKSPTPEPPCVDKKEKCPQWAKYGRCHTSSLYMIKYCKKSCKICVSSKEGEVVVEADVKPCFDVKKWCRFWARLDYCSRLTWTAFMYRYCPLSCQACSPGQGDEGDSRCKNEDKINCDHWARLGKCKSRPQFMMEKCQKSCNACPKSTPKTVPAKPVGIRCSKQCKYFLKKGLCTSRLRRRCLRICMAKGCDDEPVRLMGRCSEALGAGWNESLPDSAFTASSVMSYSTPRGGKEWDFGAHNARLYKEDDFNRKRVGAWCASKSKHQWLQVDLGKIKTVTAVATQGRDKYFEHVKTYELSFSEDGKNWIRYKEKGKLRILQGNCDHFTPVINQLQRKIQTRFMRFHPLTFNNICMRVEIYGCDGKV